MSDPTIDMLLEIGLRYIKRTDVDRIRDRIERGKFDPCQTPGCDGVASLEPNRCVKCADRDGESVFPEEAEHG